MAGQRICKANHSDQRTTVVQCSNDITTGSRNMVVKIQNTAERQREVSNNRFTHVRIFATEILTFLVESSNTRKAPGLIMVRVRYI